MEHLFHVFLTVAELCNFSKTAEKLNITQPAVSKLIKNLEEAYDVVLFERANRVKLTPAGEALLPYAQKILSLHKESFTVLNDFRTSNTPIKIGSSITIGDYILPQIITTYKNQTANNLVRVKVGRTNEIIQKLLNEEIDAALVVEEAGKTTLAEEPFWEDELVLAISPQHPFGDKDVLEAKDLANEYFIIRESGSHKMAEEVLKSAGVELTFLNSMEAGSILALKEFAEKGLGIAIVFHVMVEKEIKQGTLKVLRISGHRMIQKFYWVVKKHKHLPKNIESFKKVVFSPKMISQRH
ncbi:LysR family transcriptional regulator [Neobacillus massiliamazoniensis]|uniref:LysR family transcriptional regulator n=1 Tax=Neobacillus massiliamazoniensis TaxID=1499688 RepID=A0A0U1NYL1_9BACI|nr:LysR family transcriptional regulator [Neobacillus massiliamazoniensis]CRK83096.1 LysR family transcriptional regulator [Neobacillus massiliamazoniensis]